MLPHQLLASPVLAESSSTDRDELLIHLHLGNWDRLCLDAHITREADGSGRVCLETWLAC